MPDHVHILVSSDEGSDLVRFVHGFKQRTGWWLRNRYVTGGLKASPTTASASAGLWQKSYYDHILRREEDVYDVIRYILENPVQAGIVDLWSEYPYSWSRYDAPEPF
jgi:REP element-mobilizing transposase RayT